MSCAFSSVDFCSAPIDSALRSQMERLDAVEQFCARARFEQDDVPGYPGSGNHNGHQVQQLQNQLRLQQNEFERVQLDLEERIMHLDNQLNDTLGL